MERESSAWEDNWATLSLGNINTGTWPSTCTGFMEHKYNSIQVGEVSKNLGNKIWLSSAGLSSERDCAGEAKQQQ
jgi:hypothetical protein